MKTILVVNGETIWEGYFRDYKVERKLIQHSEWLLKNGKLMVLDEDSIVEPDLILWRLGAIKPEPKHRTVLEIIRHSGVPCVNDAATLLQGYDRLSMLQVLKSCDLPVIPFEIASSAFHLKNIGMPFPFVVKAGNYHGGFGKALVENEQQWQDIKDVLYMSNDYVTVEKFIRYDRDIRYLACGDKVWAMARKGKFWKANVETTDFILIEPEEELTLHVKKLQAALNADLVAIDVLETKSGEQFVVEYNDIPGLRGFPVEVKQELVACVLKKL